MNGAPWQDETVQALKEDYQRVIDQHAATIARLRGLLQSTAMTHHERMKHMDNFYDCDVATCKNAREALEAE